LARAHPADRTLQNLLSTLNSKLDMCARLPVYEYEAATEGHQDAADAFRGLAETERRTFNELVVTLRRHLDRVPASAVANTAARESR
jgi:hypothetical protein